MVFETDNDRDSRPLTNYECTIENHIIEEIIEEEKSEQPLRTVSAPSDIHKPAPIAQVQSNLKVSAISTAAEARASIPNENTNESDSDDYEIDEPEYHSQKPFSFETNAVFGHGMSEPCSISMLQYSLDKRKYLRPFPVSNASEKRDDSVSTVSVI